MLLEPEASGGAVGVVCEKGVGWEFGLISLSGGKLGGFGKVIWAIGG